MTQTAPTPSAPEYVDLSEEDMDFLLGAPCDGGNHGLKSWAEFHDWMASVEKPTPEESFAACEILLD